MGGISITQLLIILVIVLLLFGSKKLKTLGSDLGSAFKGFKKAVSEEDKKDADFEAPKTVENRADESQATVDKQTQKQENQ